MIANGEVFGTHTWSDVVFALIITLPSLISAVAAIMVHRQVKPSNGRRLAEITEDTHSLATENAAIAQQVVAGDVEPPHGTDASSPAGSDPERHDGTA